MNNANETLDRGAIRVTRPGFWKRSRTRLAQWLRLDLTHSQIRYGRVLQEVVRPGIVWLDVGCGRQILPDWAMPLVQQRLLANQTRLFVGIDVDAAMHQHPLVDHKVTGLGGTFPFADCNFDLITANMVVEHIPDADTFLSDVHRILKPGGCFVFHTPNFRNYLVFIASLVPDFLKVRIIWILERRQAEDVFPTYYRLNTRRQIEEAASRCGLSVDFVRVVNSSGTFVLLGPVAWLECFWMKFLEAISRGQWNSNLICSLRRGTEG